MSKILYHLTDNPDFQLDPDFEPEAALDIPGMRIKQPGVYLTSDPEYWIREHNYWRPYTAEIEVSDPLAGREEYERNNGSYPEVFVPQRMLDQIKLKSVRPTSFPPPKRKRRGAVDFSSVGGGIEPTMGLDRQIRKVDQAILDARKAGDEDRARYTEFVKDLMLSEVKAGRPRPFSFYSPMIEEEFS